MKLKQKLQPCPFCKRYSKHDVRLVHEPEVYPDIWRSSYWSKYYVKCSCGAIGPYSNESSEDAIKKWNNR